MSVTAGAVMDQSAALLSDPSKITFNYIILLPYVKVAWDELQEGLFVNGIADVEEGTSTPFTVTAGVKEWAGPVDLLSPTTMWEKAVGAPDETYEEMEEKKSDPDESAVETLQNWWYAEGVFKFKGATTDRIITLSYDRELAVIQDETTVLPVKNCKSFLAFRTGALAAAARGNNSRSRELDASAVFHYDQVVAAKVKDEQAMPVRPRRYGFTRRR